MKFPWPMCGKCRKPVERVDTDEDIRRQVVVITAHCHGDTDCSELPVRLLVSANEMVAVAFEQPKLPEG